LSPKRHELNLLDTAQVDKFLSKNQPNIVIYSVVNIYSLEENMTTYFNLERCSSKFDKMITIGSGAEYDIKNYKPLMSEEYFSQNIPSDTYGLSKFIISNDIRKKPRNIINLRVFGIYGKYEDYTRRFISNNISRALCGKKISMNRNMRFDFLYVNDFVEILEQFFTTDAKHRNYNICTGEPVEFIEIANIINDIHVSKIFQGLGYGTEILNIAISKCKELNAKQIKVFVFNENPALKFYKKNGFKVIKNLERSNSCVMVLDLN